MGRPGEGENIVLSTVMSEPGVVKFKLSEAITLLFLQVYSGLEPIELEILIFSTLGLRSRFGYGCDHLVIRSY